MQTVIDFFVNNRDAIISILTYTVAVASAIANFTPTEADNKVVAWISKAINWLALNFKTK